MQALSCRAVQRRPTTTCLDDATVQGIIEHCLGDAALAEAKIHVDECPHCRELVSAAALASVRTEPADANATPLAARDRIGRYELIEQLGAGSMGVVYRARDPQLNREIAIKVLHTAVASDPDLMGRLSGEAEAMARLSHPNVVAVHDAGRDGDRVFIAMELVRGTTLTRWLARGPEWRDVIRLAGQIGRGLAAVHEAGLVHRDFKPDNVLVSERDHACVTDFGLARSTAHASSPRPVLIGTPAYMAPEQLLGLPADARSDQFGFCVILYEGLYRTSPFRADHLAGALESMRAGPPAAPPDKHVPARIHRVLARGLRFRPEDRHPSIDALLGELEHAARGPRRRRTAIAIGATTAIAAAALVVRPWAGPGEWRPEIRPVLPVYDEAIGGASISPDGTEVAFTSDRQHPFHPTLYVEPLAGGVATRWAPDRELSMPRWAADGGSVYAIDPTGTGWRVFRDGHVEKIGDGLRTVEGCADRLVLHFGSTAGCVACERLVVRNAGGAERELYRTQPGGAIDGVRCAHDGRKLVFTLTFGDGPVADLWIAPLDGGPVRRITNDPFLLHREPAFTADDRSLIVSRVRDGIARLWELSLDDTGAERQLIAGPGNERDPSVSPDGSTLYFENDESTDVLFARSLDGRPPVRLSRTIEDVAMMLPTPDGRAVLASVIRDMTAVLIEIDLVTRAERIITEGRVIALVHDELIYDWLYQLWARPRAGGPARLVAPMPLRLWYAAPGGDGAIHFMVGTDAGFEAWRAVIDRDTLEREDGTFQLPAPVGGWRAALTLAKTTEPSGDDIAVLRLVPPISWQGAAPQPIENITGPLAWDADGRAILYLRGDTIRRVSVPEGEDRVVLEVPGVSHFAPSPDGRTIYTIERVERRHAMRIINFDQRHRP